MATYHHRRTYGLLLKGDIARRLGVCTKTITKLVAERVIPAPRHQAAGLKSRLWHESEVKDIERRVREWFARPRPNTYRRPEGLYSLGDLAKLFGRPRVTLEGWRRKALFPKPTHGPHYGCLWYSEADLPDLRRAYRNLWLKA